MSLFLFVVGSATSYRLQRIFAQHCADRGHRVAFAYDAPPDALFDEVRLHAQALGAQAVSLDDLVVPDAPARLRWLKMPHPLRAFAFSRLAARESSIHRRILEARLAAAQGLLSRLAPDAVIVAEDGISGPAALIAAARSLDVPVVDIPYGYGTQKDLDNALDEKAARGELLHPTESRLGRMVRRFAPVWLKTGHRAGAVMFPEEYIAAREALGMTLRNAWTVHGGHADKLLVESRQMMSLYLGEGVPRAKLALTGSPYCDVMASALARDAAAQAAFRKPQPIQAGLLKILVSWPTSYHGTRAEHCEFPSYEEMSRRILGWLHGLPGCALTVSLHPAVPPAMRAELEGLGLDIVPDYVIGLIPRHDIYVSYFSSTQRWAVACGKPVVNYDAYGVGLDVYDAAPGFIGTRSFEEFKAEMLRMTQGGAEGFRKAAAAQIAVAEEWGVVDGRCMDRMLDQLPTGR